MRQQIQQTIPFAGRSSFALNHAKRRSIKYLKDIGKECQIKHIPNKYPSYPGLVAKVDIAVRAKLLKAHLEDAFAQNNFSVVITRRKASPVMKITHDSRSTPETEMIACIVKLYLSDTTKYIVTKLQRNLPLMILQ